MTATTAWLDDTQVRLRAAYVTALDSPAWLALDSCFGCLWPNPTAGRTPEEHAAWLLRAALDRPDLFAAAIAECPALVRGLADAVGARSVSAGGGHAE